MISEKLSGTLVLVHPELTHDPAGRQNEIGIIVNSDLINDNILVGFQDNERALFAADALLVLLPDEDIHRNLSEMSYGAAWDKIKSLTQVDLFLRYGSGDKQLKALEVARDNKNIRHLSLQTLEASLELRLGRGYD
jgi:hypothetical protein